MLKNYINKIGNSKGLFRVIIMSQYHQQFIWIYNILIIINHEIIPPF